MHIGLIVAILARSHFGSADALAMDLKAGTPMVINTWNFQNATAVAWKTLSKGGTALDAVEKGCSEAEADLTITSVGWGNHPDESGETTLDSLIFDGPSHKVGAVGSLRRIKSAISVARRVLENTEVTFLVGEQATKFAVQMGFKEESLSSNVSIKDYKQWLSNNCQPNYWTNVTPDPKTSCGPYKPKPNEFKPGPAHKAGYGNHDTIGMIAIDEHGRIAAGTSTNGLAHKIAGRVGDTPIPGSGAYVDQDVGAAAATGDGDVMMRFVPTYQAVESMRQGLTPSEAAKDAISRIQAKYPKNMAAVIVASKNGQFGAACYGVDVFPFCIRNQQTGEVIIHQVPCLKTT